ncbi:hypothetical protein TRIUR3_04373 [Triticum urartu]|uniref:Uncharacterized protein n=1 Tax=Triticum urartu TaxID=4572 RepID=M8AQ34_TRIUA|nr:hypothetical protein TRIUR3_04373 [Triticum urartu]
MAIRFPSAAGQDLERRNRAPETEGSGADLMPSTEPPTQLLLVLEFDTGAIAARDADVGGTAVFMEAANTWAVDTS